MTPSDLMLLGYNKTKSGTPKIEKIKKDIEWIRCGCVCHLKYASKQQIKQCQTYMCNHCSDE